MSTIDDISKCQFCVGFNIRKADRVISQHYEAALKPSGIRATQFSLLACIRVAGTPTINDLAKYLMMDRTTVTRNLQHLEKMGFVSIDEGTDRRTRKVSLTTSGSEKLKEAYPYWTAAQEAILVHLAEGEWERMRSAIGDLAEAVREG